MKDSLGIFYDKKTTGTLYWPVAITKKLTQVCADPAAVLILVLS
jgi:hypothetical protein